MQFWSKVANILPKKIKVNNTNLIDIGIANVNEINNTWVPEFKTLPDGTREAALVSRRITEEKVEPLLNLLEENNVTRIDLFDAKFPDELIARIVDRRLKIVELNVSCTKFNDKLLLIIAKIPTLKKVYAEETDLTSDAEKLLYSFFPAGREISSESVRIYCK